MFPFKAKVRFESWKNIMVKSKTFQKIEKMAYMRNKALTHISYQICIEFIAINFTKWMEIGIMPMNVRFNMKKCHDGNMLEAKKQNTQISTWSVSSVIFNLFFAALACHCIDDKSVTNISSN